MTRAGRPRARGLALFLCVAGAGCGEGTTGSAPDGGPWNGTQLVVFASLRDAPGFVQVTEVEVRVTGPNNVVGGRASRLPVSFSVVPPADEPDADVGISIRVEIEDDLVLERSARTQFVPMESRRLDLPVEFDCLYGCPERQTCIDGRCRSDRIAPADLEPW